MKKASIIIRIILICLVCLVCLVCLYGLVKLIKTIPNNQENLSQENQNEEQTKSEIIISDETKKIVEQTVQAVENKEDLSTKEIPQSTEEEERTVTDEGALETDAVIEQENISYDGDSSGSGIFLLGEYQGLTYYSQADSRWANIVYSSTGNTSQTMKSSSCGPTAAAIVVSSSKGAILPTTMAKLAVDNGYRTANNGTAWAYYSFVADYFDFNQYSTTSSFNKAMDYLKQKDENGNNKYYIIASCGSGLFTTGGHYVVLVANNNNILTVYDPYLYNGKFNTSSRRNAGVVVSGNSVYVSENSFKTYANYKNFWIFSNDKGAGNANFTEAKENIASVNYTRYISTQSANLNVRTGPGINYERISSLAKGTKVTIAEVNGQWSKITSPVTGWVSNSYLSSAEVENLDSKANNSLENTVGKYKRLAKRTILYSNSNLTGTKYQYLALTQVKIVKNISSTVDYVYVVKTKRYAYVNKNAYK